MAKTKATARASTGGEAPRKQLSKKSSKKHGSPAKFTMKVGKNEIKVVPVKAVQYTVKNLHTGKSRSTYRIIGYEGDKERGKITNLAEIEKFGLKIHHVNKERTGLSPKKSKKSKKSGSPKKHRSSKKKASPKPRYVHDPNRAPMSPAKVKALKKFLTETAIPKVKADTKALKKKYGSPSKPSAKLIKDMKDMIKRVKAGSPYIKSKKSKKDKSPSKSMKSKKSPSKSKKSKKSSKSKSPTKPKRKYTRKPKA